VGTWPLSAVVLAAVLGLAAGALLGRWFAPPAPARALAAIDQSSEGMSAAVAAAAGHPLALLGLDEGDFILIRYQVGGARIWHERLILAFQPVAPFGCGILTPDGHGYVEVIANGGADVAEFCIPAGGAAGGNSAATGGDQVYRFRALPLPAAVAAAATATRGTLGLAPGPAVALNTVGRVIAPPAPAPAAVGAPAAAGGPAAGGVAGLAAALGAPAAVGAPAPGAAAGALVPAAAPAGPAPGGGLVPVAAAPAAGALLAAGPVGVPAPAAAAPAAAAVAPGWPDLGAGALANAFAAVAAAPGGDARMQAIVLDSQGVRYVDFRTAVMRMHELPWHDWPLKGPRTLLWVLNYICRNGGTPLGRHTKWKAEAYLDDEDPGVDVHLLCCRLLEFGVVYDQTHATNLASMELVGRTLQTQEELYRDRFTPTSEHGNDAALLSGVQDAGSGICMAPALRDWLAAEKSREAAIAKERRKAVAAAAEAVGDGAVGAAIPQ
ncbi:unnamed protein product, partial [Prorocentrum cordatum]